MAVRTLLASRLAPPLATLASQIKAADAFVFVTGEYNWGVQPGLKNLTDHFLEEWFWLPAAIVSYSAGRIAGARAALHWHGTLSEMGMNVISSTLAVRADRLERAIGVIYRPETELASHYFDASLPQ
jgi:NAD(P)H-dependent FMN reductase